MAAWRLAASVLCAVTSAANAAPAADGRRVALVIGNATYTALPALPACTASANVVAAALRRAGFEVSERLDLTNGEMGAAIADWDASSSGASAVVYVCGYAVGYDNRDFLLPVSARIERDTDALTQGVLAKSLLDAAGRSGARAALVLVDAVAKPASTGRLALDTLAGNAPTASVGFAAASTTTTPPQGATPLATAFSTALAAPQIDMGKLLDTLRQHLAGTTGTQFAARAPSSPVWLIGGPAPAPAPPPPVATPPAPAAPAAAAPTPPPPTAGPDEAHMTDADRRRIQDALLRLGYYDGRVDGIFGPDTRAAIRRFQHEIGAEMSGHITPEQSGRLLAGGS
ncbi:MAG: peptidoglycan-binding protein [Alphaproteobacteria bacterium]|nr:peptidoglycan-binding protein [Alphaproteobacteria bacterium]